MAVIRQVYKALGLQLAVKIEGQEIAAERDGIMPPVTTDKAYWDNLGMKQSSMSNGGHFEQISTCIRERVCDTDICIMLSLHVVQINLINLELYCVYT